MPISIGSDLERQGWVKDNLLKKQSVLWWSPFIGNTSSAIVYQVMDTSCKTGHTVVFDYDGKLEGGIYGHDEDLFGKGEVKRKFSSNVTVEERNHVAKNGNKFDACAIDDLEDTRHGDSIDKLGDLYIRYKDQSLFDAASGATTQAPSHIIDLGTSFEYNDLVHIGSTALTGEDLVSPDANGVVSDVPADIRSPLDGYTGRTGISEYVLVLDNYSKDKIKTDPKYQTIIIGADVRGDNNRVIRGEVGKLENMTVVTSPKYFGTTKGKGTFDVLDNETLQFSGLRRYAVLSDGTMAWEGQVAFNETLATWKAEKANNIAHTVKIYSRNLLLGAGALQRAVGSLADYKLEWANFKKSSESLLEYWDNSQKTVLTSEIGGDYTAKVADIDYGIIAVDLQWV